jgi:hypothetical protein
MPDIRQLNGVVGGLIPVRRAPRVGSAVHLPCHGAAPCPCVLRQTTGLVSIPRGGGMPAS